MSSAALKIVRSLDMKPHPEGGWYRETFRDERTDKGGRSRSTAIYYLLEAGETSEWHRVRDAAEVWHWYAGAPLVITVSENGHDASAHRLGPNIEVGERPQFVVPAGCWQTATSLGEYTLVGCTVAPGFDFKAFEMAPKDWRPTPRKS
ncbi:cupin domain-containing protein [Jiella sp. MQZ9-1]|uniref:Cupin domain-containing protein n=1 Tax=Jiella flava TaxID=2816857 RepID=A0A939FZU5_9HYPH|nr:cupin domain-containing protein [Jiella flava]MBO0663879.1 cupin domain-containing protein [Jiella flava]MCD2472451.1 cupin domain-containing protein [Jiella flava]